MFTGKTQAGPIVHICSMNFRQRREHKKKAGIILSAILGALVSTGATQAGAIAAARVRTLRMREDVPTTAALIATCGIVASSSLTTALGGIVATHFGNLGSIAHRLQSVSRRGGRMNRAEWTTNSAVRGEWNDPVHRELERSFNLSPWEDP